MVDLLYLLLMIIVSIFGVGILLFGVLPAVVLTLSKAWTLGRLLGQSAFASGDLPKGYTNGDT